MRARIHHRRANALANDSWVHMIRGSPSAQSLVEYFGLWDITRRLELAEFMPDEVSWRLTTNASYSAKSTYEMFFMGRTEMPGARELWSSSAPLKFKLHMWLVLKNRLWPADRLAKRGLQHRISIPCAVKKKK